MKLKNASAAGSVMAVRGGVLVHDKDGVCEVEGKELCDLLVKGGWKSVGKEKKVPPAEPKKESKPRAEPEAKKKEAPKKEVVSKKETSEEESKKKKVSVPRRERPSFKRRGE